MTQLRQSAPFKGLQAFLDQSGATQKLTTAEITDLNTRLAITSSYFQVHGRLRLADRVLLETSLVTPGTTAGQYIVLDRQRVAAVE
jgi:hypothetical protein